jgi:hypothetical protein
VPAAAASCGDPRFGDTGRVAKGGRRRGGAKGPRAKDSGAKDRRAEDGRGGSRGRGTEGGAARGRGRRAAREPLSASVAGGTAELVPDPDHLRAWSLLLEGAPQSYVDLDDPSRLGFEYQRRLGHVVDLAAPPGRPLQVLHLGGGALSLARYVAATRPRSVQQVFEKDTALSQWVRGELPLERGWRIRVRGGDAREGLGKLPSGWADLVIADVFAGARTPAHLTSVEFLHEVRRVLRTGGVYAANIADGPGGVERAAGERSGEDESSTDGDGRDEDAGGARPGSPGTAGARRPLDHLRSQVATAGEVFGTLVLAADPAMLRGRRFSNAVLVATDGESPAAELSRRCAGDPYPARVESGDALAAFTGGARPVTDATARPSPTPPDGVFR